jgi:hypothetical protein
VRGQQRAAGQRRVRVCRLEGDDPPRQEHPAGRRGDDHGAQEGRDGSVLDPPERDDAREQGGEGVQRERDEE